MKSVTSFGFLVNNCTGHATFFVKPQNMLVRPLHKSIQRGQSDSSGTIFVQVSLKSYFDKKDKNRSQKNGSSRFGFSSPRAFRTWSRICRSLFGFFVVSRVCVLGEQSSCNVD